MNQIYIIVRKMREQLFRQFTFETRQFTYKSMRVGDSWCSRKECENVLLDG